MTIQLKRIYEPPAKMDGTRVLVDRVWPRGVSKKDARLDYWLRDVAPSSDLRKWFGHDPDKWKAFKRRYFRELDAAQQAVDKLREALGEEGATLVYAAKDQDHNNAVALKDYLQNHG